MKNTPRALIIDDETDVCYLLKGILRQKNIDASYAGSLADGEDFIREKVPDFIFLDNHLPDGFGVDRIRHLKQEHPLCKIVMITAHDTPADREKAYLEGVDYFIGKPFTKDVILKTVEKII